MVNLHAKCWAWCLAGRARFRNICKGVEYTAPPVNETFLCGNRIVVSRVMLEKGSLCVSKASGYEQRVTQWKLSFKPTISILPLMNCVPVQTHLLPGLSFSSNNQSAVGHPDTHYLIIVCAGLRLDTLQSTCL